MKTKSPIFVSVNRGDVRAVNVDLDSVAAGTAKADSMIRDEANLGTIDHFAQVVRADPGN